MAKFGQTYNTEEIYVDDYKPLPVGDYLAIIEESEIGTSKSNENNNYLKLTFKILSDKYKDRKLWAYMNVKNDNPTAQQIGLKEMGKVLRALGMPRVSDSDEFLKKTLILNVEIETDYEGKKQNVIKGYKAAVNHAATTTSTAPPPRQAQGYQSVPGQQVNQVPPTNQAVNNGYQGYQQPTVQGQPRQQVQQANSGAVPPEQFQDDSSDFEPWQG